MPLPPKYLCPLGNDSYFLLGIKPTNKCASSGAALLPVSTSHPPRTVGHITVGSWEKKGTEKQKMPCPETRQEDTACLIVGLLHMEL